MKRFMLVLALLASPHLCSLAFAGDNAWKEKGIALCREKIAAGWKSVNPLDERHDGEELDSLKGKVCAARKTVEKKSSILLFAAARPVVFFNLQASAQEEESVEALKRAFLKEVRVATKKLGMGISSDLTKQIELGTPFEEDIGNIHFQFDVETREAELLNQPDSKPQDFPFRRFKFEISPPEL